MKRRVSVVVSKIAPFIAIISLLTLVYFVIKSDYFLVTEVKVFGEKEVFSNVSSLQKNHNILFLNTSNLAQELATDNPLSKNVVVKKIFPHTLEIQVEKRIPVIALEAVDGYFFLDEEGFILSKEYLRSKLPVIKVASIEISPEGKIVDANLVKGIQIMIKTIQSGFSVEFAELAQEKNEIIMMGDKVRIIVPLTQEIYVFFSSLQLLARQFKIEGKQPTFIDFRFDKPVVRF